MIAGGLLALSLMTVTTWTAISAQTEVPTPVPVETPAATPVPGDQAETPFTQGQVWPIQVNWDSIFPPSEARTLVFLNCNLCHSILYPVYTQRSAQRWQVVMMRHVSRLPTLRADELSVIFAYLAENFNDTKPVPPVPQWMADWPW
jgi:hypothetical protein